LFAKNYNQFWEIFMTNFGRLKILISAIAKKSQKRPLEMFFPLQISHNFGL